jgi:hypothetical protein
MRIGVRVALTGTLALAGCTDLARPIQLPELDRNDFRCNVQPVLQARCGFIACHGDAGQPFRVYARNRLRLDLDLSRPELRNAPLSAEEEQRNFDVARGFARGGSAKALLLRKPLDESAGGFFHRARDLYGGTDVFATEADRGFVILKAWVDGAQHPPDDCVPVEEVGP